MKVTCIRNPTNLPYIKIGGIYEVLSELPSRPDFFILKAELNTKSFYRKDWFEDISTRRDIILTEILK